MMSFEKRMKMFQRTIARYGLYFTSWLIKRMPYKAIRVVSDIFIAIGFRLTNNQRKIAKESLRLAFGKEKGPSEIDQIVRKCFENVGRGMIEMLYFMSHPSLVAQKVSFDGKEHLKEALKKGRGVIAVTAHFGNFPLMMMHLALEGYKTNAIIRPARDQELESYLFKKRTETGLKTIYAVPRQQCVMSSLAALRNNEVLFIPLDQNFGSNGGIFVDFFGHKAATATGPVVFARRTKAPILPMFIIRLKEDTHKIIIEPPLSLEEVNDEEAFIVLNTEKITKLIEHYIRLYPHEWGWMHKRWKSQPSFKTNRQ